MSALYPFRLEPQFYERVWGARDLAPFFDRHVEPGEQPIGEAWLTGDACRVANGPLTGKTLAEVARQYGRELVGECAPQPDCFPLLIKFLFPRDKLSVQVHPDDETARRCGQPCGKTECWYVLEAEPGAQVALGLKPGTTRAEFERAIAETRAEALLNWMDVHAGEMLYVEAGTVHAIGPGAVLLETQQNSDTTYRLYDYGRPRALHVREGLDALKEETAAGKVRQSGDEEMATLVSSPCFVVEKFRVDSPLSGRNFPDWNTVEVLVGLDGMGVVDVPGCAPVTLARGEAVVIPATIGEFEVKPQWTAEFLAITLPPSTAVTAPATFLPERAAMP